MMGSRAGAAGAATTPRDTLLQPAQCDRKVPKQPARRPRPSRQPRSPESRRRPLRATSAGRENVQPTARHTWAASVAEQATARGERGAGAADESETVSAASGLYGADGSARPRSRPRGDSSSIDPLLASGSDGERRTPPPPPRCFRRAAAAASSRASSSSASELPRASSAGLVERPPPREPRLEPRLVEDHAPRVSGGSVSLPELGRDVLRNVGCDVGRMEGRRIDVRDLDNATRVQMMKRAYR